LPKRFQRDPNQIPPARRAGCRGVDSVSGEAAVQPGAAEGQRDEERTTAMISSQSSPCATATDDAKDDPDDGIRPD
jgi:hypothetical protein